MRMKALVLAATLVTAASGCAVTHAERGVAPTSIFPKLRTDVMTEEAIAAALDARIDLHVPERVLVVAADELTGYERPMARRLAATLADKLGDSAFFLPTLAMPLDRQNHDANDPVLPLQRLREKAARYRTPYALITFMDVTHETSATPLSLLYAPLVTLLFVPGERVEARADVHAVLLDVRTGIILQTTWAELERSDSFVRLGHTWEARSALEGELASRGGEKLAEKLERATRQWLKLRSTIPANGDLRRIDPTKS
jgi:hypothetical protein